MIRGCRRDGPFSLALSHLMISIRNYSTLKSILVCVQHRVITPRVIKLPLLSLSLRYQLVTSIRFRRLILQRITSLAIVSFFLHMLLAKAALLALHQPEMIITFSPQHSKKIRRILSLVSCLSTKCSTNTRNDWTTYGLQTCQRGLFWRLGTLKVNHNRKFREMATSKLDQRGPFKVAPGFGPKTV